MELSEIPRLDPSGKEMVDFITYICDEVGPRIGGSEQEKRAGDIIQERLDFCDETTQEEFTCRPGGFLDFIWVTAAFYILGVFSYYFISPLVSLILIFIALAVYSIQQNFLYEVVDFLFPEVTSYHIIGKIKPTKKPTKLVLLAGHHDSAYEFPLLSKLGEKSMFVIITAVGIILLNMLLCIIRTGITLTQGSFSISDPFEFMREIPTLSISTTVDLVQSIIFIIGVIVILGVAFNLRSNKVVLGANDNLTGVAAVIEVGKFLSKNKPVNTEIWLVSFAGEEHMRGSKRFVSTHREELKKRQALLFNLESLNTEAFLIATGETMHLTKHSPLVVDFATKAAEKVASKTNFSFKVDILPFAGSDATNFSKKGLHATTLFGMSPSGMPLDWHTLNDTPDKLVGSRLAKAAEIALQFVYEVDQSE
jgi:hypothetical protein